MESQARFPQISGIHVGVFNLNSDTKKSILENFLHKDNLVYLAISAGFFLSLFVYWPGFLSTDASWQLKQAISNTYTDGSPPMMAFYWRQWIWWKQGPEPMFLTHQLMLWGAAGIFARSFHGKKEAWFFAIAPLLPHVFFYSSAIWKDSSFAFSFLLAAALLTESTLSQIRPGWVRISAILALLFYGTGVKYQAQFVLPLFLLWLTSLLFTRGEKSFSIKSLCLVAILQTAILTGLYLFQTVMLPSNEQEHMWQYVKLYDLAGISVQLNKSVFPPTVEEKDTFSMTSVRNHYDPRRVDELIDSKGPIRRGTTDATRQEILDAWYDAVQAHPLLYLKHRYMIWKTMVSLSPVKTLDELANPERVPQKVKVLLNHGGKSILSICKEITRFIYYMPFLIGYFLIGLVMRRKSPYAKPLVYMTGSGLVLMGVLFVFSMAADLRYIYLVMCLLSFSHIFAYKCLKILFKNQTTAQNTLLPQI